MRRRREPSRRGREGEEGGRGKLTKFRLLVLVRYNLWPRRVDRMAERMRKRRVDSSLPLFSLFAAEASYYGVISTPPVSLPPLPHIAVLNSHIVTLRDPDQVQSRTHSGGGYCNFYRWTGVRAVTRKKSDLYEMTRPIARAGHPTARCTRARVHLYVSRAHVQALRARARVRACDTDVHMPVFPRAVGPRSLFARLSFALAANANGIRGE